MPSFLNKVFGYKKHDEAVRPTREASDNTLLDGKYEAISPTLSPSASTFPEPQPAKDSDRDGTFSFLKPKSRGLSQKSTQKHLESVPHLTLHLPLSKEGTDSRELGIVFEANPDSHTLLDDAVIAARRLDPGDALVLVRLCAQAITERGMETLGVMHPYWFSASPDVQRKLISLFIRSLTPQTQPTTLSSTPTSPTSAFENELHYTRSPHDVAAVLRWGLRHLSLENGHFGKDSAEWAWYNNFFNAERNASYPPKGFSELLLPQLPPSHIELLTATLKMITSLASHAEANGISGSKLSKFLGLWLLVAARAEQSDDWNRFYARWEHAGRILEHLFLARLREESLGQRLPTRLQELVKHYPYRGSSTTEDDLLSRPRFSTRQYDALLVRVETVLAQSGRQPKKHPIQLLLDAFQLPIDNPSGDELTVFWNALKTTVSEEDSSSDSEGLQFTRIFADETMQLLALLPVDDNISISPILPSSPIPKVMSRKRSSSLTKILERTANNGPTSTSPSSAVVTDWAQFSLSGFGDTSSTQPLVSLLDPNHDFEVSQLSRKSSRQRDKSRTRRRRSQDSPASPRPEVEASIVETRLASVHVAQIDEAFIDFWSDAIVDPISANWPTFVVCGLKQIPSMEQPIRWLIIEQTYSRQQSQSARHPSPDGHRGRSPRPSFKSDISGFRINSMFSSARKRFSVFSKSVTDLDPRKLSAKSPITGELGQILVEEEPTFPSIPPKADVHVDGNAAVETAITSYTTANVADQLKVGGISTAPITALPPSHQLSVLKKKSDLAQAMTKGLTIKATPQSGGASNGFSELPPLLVGVFKEAAFIEQASPCTLDSVDLQANIADSVATIAPADTTQNTSDPVALPSGPRPIAENPTVEESQGQVEQLPQYVVQVKDRPSALVTQPTTHDGPIPVESADESSNAAQVGSQLEVAEVVAMPPAPEGIAVEAASPAVDEAPKVIAEEPRVAEQPSWITPADPVAAFTVESIGQHEIGDVPSLSTTDVLGKVVSTAVGAQLESDSIGHTVDAVEEAKEVTEVREVPTPAPQVVALVEETPGLVERVGATQVRAAELEPLEKVVPQLHTPHAAASRLEVLDNAVPQYMAAELQPTVNAAESSTTQLVEGSSVEIAPATDTNTQVLTGEAEHAADHVPTFATEEASNSQDTLVEAAEAPLVEALSVPEVGADVAVRELEGTALTEVQTQATPGSLIVSGVHFVEDMSAPTPVPESAVLIHETPGPEIASEPSESVDVVVGVGLELETAEGKAACESAAIGVKGVDAPPTGPIPPVEEAQPSTAEAELPTQVPDTQQPAEIAPSIVAVAEPIEDTPTASVAEEAQVHEDVARSASEPLADPTIITQGSVVIVPDVQAPIENEDPSSEAASQPVDESAKPRCVTVAVPEETRPAEVQAQLASEAVHLTADTVDGPREATEDAAPVPRGPEVDQELPVEGDLAEAEDVSLISSESQPRAVSAVEMDETSGAGEPQQVEQPVAFEVDELTGLSEENVPVEP